MHFGCYTHISVHTHQNLWRPDCMSLVNQQIITGKLITIIQYCISTPWLYVFKLLALNITADRQLFKNQSCNPPVMHMYIIIKSFGNHDTLRHISASVLPDQYFKSCKNCCAISCSVYFVSSLSLWKAKSVCDSIPTATFPESLLYKMPPFHPVSVSH